MNFDPSPAPFMGCKASGQMPRCHFFSPTLAPALQQSREDLPCPHSFLPEELTTSHIPDVPTS